MALLADAILIVHLLFVLFVVGGLLAIWVGALLGWRWIHSFRLRAAHLGAILFVAAESLAGLMCPLTVWEDLLRGKDAGGAGFIQRRVSGMLYYDLPESSFTALYVSKFVEDIVRDIAAVLNREERIDAYVVESENFGSCLDCRTPRLIRRG